MVFGTVSEGATASEAYTSSQTTPVTRKVGLLASYEYLYAAGDSSCYSVAGTSYPSSTCASKDWLKPNTNEFTLSPRYVNSKYDLVLTSTGQIYYSDTVAVWAIRPVVYLNSNVRISGGQGTDTQPYTLSLN